MRVSRQEMPVDPFVALTGGDRVYEQGKLAGNRLEVRFEVLIPANITLAR